MSSLLAQPKRTALLAYLAAEAPRGFQRRDTLLGLFWPEMDEARARAALSRALHFLRRGLGEAALAGRGDDELTVDPAHLWCDVVAFEQARAAGRHEEALGLYRGALLEGFLPDEVPEFERWMEGERRRLRLAAAASAGLLADDLERAGDVTGAVAAARRGAAIDPHDEVALRRLLALLGRAGDRAGAAAAYDAAARRLAADLQLEPSAETKAVMESIRAAPAHVTAAAAGGTAAPAAPPPPAPAVSAPAAERGRGRCGGPQPRNAPPHGRGDAGRRTERGGRGAASPGAAAASGGPGRARGGGGDRGGGDVAAGAAAPGVGVRSAGGRRPAVRRPLGRTRSGLLRRGMADELIAALGTIDGIDVVARTSSFAYQGKAVPVGEIARQLGATHVVEGSVRRDGDRLRVRVQLIDAATGYRLWSRAFDEPARAVLALQDAISREVVDALAPRLAGPAASPARRPGPVDPAAYDLYLQGRYLYHSAGIWDSVQNARSVDAFRAAIARDSGYAPAWAGLADVLGRLGRREEAGAAARRAVALDSTLSDARASLAYVLAYTEWRWDDAVREIDRAVELSPGSVLALVRRAGIRSAMGRVEEAVADMERAYRLDPLAPTVLQQRGMAYLRAGRHDEAIRALRTVVAARPEDLDAREALGLAYLAAGGMGEQAAAEFLAFGDSIDAAIARNDRATMLRFVREGEAVPRGGRLTPLAMAALYARLGLTDEAFAMLERARPELRGYPWGAGVPYDPRLLPLRADPRFRALAARWLAG
jgi:TolB-like protein/DNA-binding SARP family transcriptional activator